MSKQNDYHGEHRSHSSEHHSSHHHSSSHHSSSSHHHSSGHHSSSELHHSSDRHHSSSKSHHYVDNHRSSSRKTSTEDQQKINELLSKYQTMESNFDVTEQPKKKRHHHHRHHSHMRPGVKALLIIICIPLVLLIAASGTFAVLNIVGRKQINDVSTGVEENKYSVSYDEGKTITYNGNKYKLNENIVTIAGIGIDREEFGLVDDAIGTAGQADAIIIIALNLDSGKISAIMIPRDSMVDVDLYTVSGSYIGVDRMQICLSYAYGDGKVTSCENVLTSVERLLYGIPINLYGVLDIQGIPYLNDTLDGVTVDPLETFGRFTEGQRTTLYGDDAIAYVRSRNTEILNSDSLRRERQIQYIKAFSQKAASSALKDFSIITKLYNTATEYSFTNISLSKLTYLATTLLSKGISFEDIVSLKGELVEGDPYAEYIVDEEAAFETVLSIFYTPVSQ